MGSFQGNITSAQSVMCLGWLKVAGLDGIACRSEIGYGSLLQTEDCVHQAPGKGRAEG